VNEARSRSYARAQLYMARAQPYGDRRMVKMFRMFPTVPTVRTVPTVPTAVTVPTGPKPQSTTEDRAQDGPDDSDLVRVNRRFYDALWERSRLVPAERFNTWPLVASLLADAPARLEVGPGLRPRLPVAGTRFVDMSAPAVAKLRQQSADAVVGDARHLPFADATFDLVAAFDIVEHVDDDDAVLAELSRVAAGRSTLLLSAPLDPAKWTAFDQLVGHRRRYAASELQAKLARHGWTVASTAVYGMQPKSSRLLDFSVWQLQNRPERAIWIYDRIILPLAAFFQKKLELRPGMAAAETADVDEIFLVCRRAGGAPT
jgi:SAM-dependent methyltransferase